MTGREWNANASLAAFCAGVALAFITLTAAHETALRAAGHVPAVVDDESLWCVARRQVATLGREDVLLLGASRMQTDIDEATVAASMPGRRIVNLAISGGGTSWPVFCDIVRNTRFSGIILLDETECTMASEAGNEQAFVDAYDRSFTLDRLMNRTIDTLLQSRLVCLGPGESCTEVLPRVVARRRLPPPKPNVTSPTRYTRADYALVDPALLQEIRQGRLWSLPSSSDIPHLVETATVRWREVVDAFRARGGRLVFVRLPVSRERWNLEDTGSAASQAWRLIMQGLAVPSIICNGTESDAPGNLGVLDHSHLDHTDTKRFTAWLCSRLEPLFGTPVPPLP